MGIYIGYVEKKGFEPNIFFNFKPLYEIANGEVNALTQEDRRDLLPESELENLNLSYNFHNTDQRRFMDTHFSEEHLVVFEFETSELLPNEIRGERNKTGYKVFTSEVYEQGKIRGLEDENISVLVSKTEFQVDDFEKETNVTIQGTGIYADAIVFCEVSNDLYAGPYKVGFREYDSEFYVRPQLKESKYLISGYKKSDCRVIKVSSSNDYWSQDGTTWMLVLPKPDAQRVYEDKINTEQLLASFKNSLSAPNQKSGKLDLSDIDSLLAHYEESTLTGTDLPKEIQKNRMNRLIEFLTAERDLDDTQSLVAEALGDSLGNLLVKCQHTQQVNDLIKEIVHQSPDLLERVKDCRALQEQKEILEQEIEALNAEKLERKAEAAELHDDTGTAQTAVLEEKTAELEEIESEFRRKSEQLDAINKQLELTHDVASLDKEKVGLEQQVRDIEIHKRFLDESTQRLEAAFSEIVSNSHNKMVNIAFDGFMANKMISAAAKWEAEKAEQGYNETVLAVNNVPAEEMTQSELIEYLCNTIKIARPQYENNDIINIAICIAQGFLTVFSGEPGCGKTSICKLMGEVLGLNKIEALSERPDPMLESGRFVEVSVERGWTSKRDLVGYYNPLSKTFDKSNRRVFNSLKLLDLETKNEYAKFPFLILLDEANLSPMEYYWADFMNVCDDLDEYSQINLGEDYSFRVSKTLHFLATINNDHTTETLSPRLIDRAWIVSLPRFSTFVAGAAIPKATINPVTWKTISNAFIPATFSMSLEIQQIYDGLITKLRKYIVLSPRSKQAIEHFWCAAANCFEENRDGISPEKIALDYAVAQKILPKIAGGGKEYSEWLEVLRGFCAQNDLNKSAELLKMIISKGDDQMGYYSFFYNNN